MRLPCLAPPLRAAGRHTTNTTHTSTSCCLAQHTGMCLPQTLQEGAGVVRRVPRQGCGSHACLCLSRTPSSHGRRHPASPPVHIPVTPGITVVTLQLPTATRHSTRHGTCTVRRSGLSRPTRRIQQRQTAPPCRHGILHVASITMTIIRRCGVFLQVLGVPHGCRGSVTRLCLLYALTY